MATDGGGWAGGGAAKSFVNDAMVRVMPGVGGKSTQNGLARKGGIRRNAKRAEDFALERKYMRDNII